METDHATLMQRISDIFELRGITRYQFLNGAENWIKSYQLALQLPDRLRRFLDAVDEVVDFLAYLKCERCDAYQASCDPNCFRHDFENCCGKLYQVCRGQSGINMNIGGRARDKHMAGMKEGVWMYRGFPRNLQTLQIQIPHKPTYAYYTLLMKWQLLVKYSSLVKCALLVKFI